MRYIKFKDVKDSCINGKIEIIKGIVNDFIVSKNKYLGYVPDKISIDQSLYLEGNYIVKIIFDKYELIYSSLSVAYDLFYCNLNNNIFYSTDFFECVSKYGSVTKDNNSIDMFFRHGYFRPGETYFKEIHRLKACEGLIKNKEDNTWSLIFLPVSHWNITEKDYQECFINSVGKLEPRNNDSVLFSGGRDSALLALTLVKEFKIKPLLVMTTITGLGFDEGYNERNAFYSSFLNVEQKTIPLSYDDYTFDDVKPLVHKMPICSHLALSFIQMNKYISESNSRSWTGQNSDSLYCLGKTGDRLGSILDRFLISDKFLATLSDVNGNSLGGKFQAEIVAQAFSHRYGNKFKAPHNINELRYSLLETNLGLISKNDSLIHARNNKVSIKEARYLLYIDKISSHISGSDHRVVQYAGGINENNVLFPYSTVMMTLLQMNMSMRLADILNNKKYISDKIRYYIGNENYNKLYPNEVFNLNPMVKNYYKGIMSETKYGRSLYSISGSTDWQKAISISWMKEVFDELIRKNEELIIHD